MPLLDNHTPPARPIRTLSASQVDELGRLVGRDLVDRILPLLQGAVAQFAETEKGSHTRWERWRKTALSDARKAKKLDQQARRLLNVLESAFPQQSLFSLASRQPAEFSVSSLTEAESSSFYDSIYTITELAQHAREWQKRAHELSLRKRGRKYGIRRSLAGWVAELLNASGVSLKQSADGNLARVLTVMYDAADINSPQDLYRDVEAAVARLPRQPRRRVRR